MNDEQGTSMDQGVELEPETAALIRSTFERLDGMDLFTLFEVDLNASAEVLRRAYFRRSRLFHPDRYFRRQLGPYKKMLERIFAWMAASYEFLKEDANRASYRKSILRARDGGGVVGLGLIAVETPQGLEFRIADEQRAPRAVESTPSPEAVARQVVLTRKQYALPRLRRGAAPGAPASPAPPSDGRENQDILEPVADGDGPDQELRPRRG